MTSSPSLQAFGKRVLHIQRVLSWLLGRSLRRLADARASRGLSLGGSFDVPMMPKSNGCDNGSEVLVRVPAVPSPDLRLDVLPGVAFRYHRNYAPNNPEFGRKMHVSLTGKKPFPNLQDLGCHEFVRSAFFSSVVHWFFASFIPTVLLILAHCAEKEMRWPHAGRIVTLMADLQAFRDLPSVDYPRNSMNAHVPAFIFHSSIATSSPIRFGPNPAISNLWNVKWNWPIFFHSSPEPFFQGSLSRILLKAFKIAEFAFLPITFGRRWQFASTL